MQDTRKSCRTLTAPALCFDAGVRTALTKQVGDPDVELTAPTAHLDLLAAADLATAQHELVCMSAHCRTRAGVLPFPSLTRPEREAIRWRTIRRSPDRSRR